MKPELVINSTTGMQYVLHMAAIFIPVPFFQIPLHKYTLFLVVLHIFNFKPQSALKRALKSIGVSSHFNTPMERVLCTSVCCNSVKRTCEDSSPTFFPWPYILLCRLPNLGSGTQQTAKGRKISICTYYS